MPARSAWKMPIGKDKDGVEGLPNFGPPLVTAGRR
jgi:hypothetical protein